MKKVIQIIIIMLTNISIILAQNNNFNCGDDFLDLRDSISYKTIQIGTQCWFKENLKATRYFNRDTITFVTNNTEWENQSTGVYCNYDDSINNSYIYGHLYNWSAGIDSRMLCPSGWHVPSSIEWVTLTDFLGGENVASDKMKEPGFKHWSTDTSNSSGFSALPGGFRGGETTSFPGICNGLFYCSYFWSSSNYGSNGAFYFFLSNSNDETGTFCDIFNTDNGFSVRCIRDNPTNINNIHNNIQFNIYPNPSNQQTEVSYQLSENSSVNISIYDIMGRVVTDIINENEGKGSHVIKVNTQQLEDGIYILKFSSEGFVGTKKIVVEH